MYGSLRQDVYVHVLDGQCGRLLACRIKIAFAPSIHSSGANAALPSHCAGVYSYADRHASVPPARHATYCTAPGAALLMDDLHRCDRMQIMQGAEMLLARCSTACTERLWPFHLACGGTDLMGSELSLLVLLTNCIASYNHAIVI